MTSPEHTASVGLQRSNLPLGGFLDEQIFVLHFLSFIFIFSRFRSTLSLGIDESQQNHLFQ